MDLLAYIRVSTAEQAEQGHSLGQQPQRIAAWCHLHGHTLVGVICDAGVSAGVPLGKRPGGKELLARLAAGEAQGVVAQRIDRLFRNARDGLGFAEDFAIKHGVSLHTVDGALDTSTPAGWLMLAVSLVTAQYERLMDSTRARETSRSLRAANRVYGIVPFGCIEVGATDGKRGELRRCPAAWPVRDMIVAWRNDGAMRTSLRTIRARLHERGIAAPSGGKHWSLDTLKNLIDSHAALCHLPMADHVTPAAKAAPETEVSPE